METNLKNLPGHFKPDMVMKGEKGEMIVSTLLQKDGYYVTNLANIKGGAPGMRNNDDYLILPDLQVALKGYLGYCEVKFKTKPTYTYITKRYEHGVDKINWDHYLGVRDTTGAPVFLFIYEGTTGLVLYNSVDFLQNIMRFSPKMGKGGMYFWPQVSFRKWGIVAIMDGKFYQQLSIFDRIGIKGKGDKLFGINRIHKGPL